MFFELVLRNNVLLVIGSGASFAIIGMLMRKTTSAGTDRDNLIYADGFQGATIATLFVVATMVYYISDSRAIVVLREQASMISLFSLLGCLQFADRFRRSLR